MFNIEKVAEVVHEVNKAYCEFLNDDSQEHWEDAPDYARESAIAGVQAVIDNPDVTAAQQHANWMEHKLKDGWKHGKKKDGRKKTHPCLLPFNKLKKEQQLKDILFITVAKQLLNNDFEIVGTFSWALSCMKEGFHVTRPDVKGADKVFMDKNHHLFSQCDVRGTEPWKATDDDLMADNWQLVLENEDKSTEDDTK